MEDKHNKNGSQPPPGGALFPRLHVKETKNAGPRAPPRNKMALYEQFTIPSHRFQQQQATGASPQPYVPPQALNGGYYFPYYMLPSPVAFQPMNVVLGQQHQHSQSVANESTEQSELQEVPGDCSNRDLARIPSLQSRAGPGQTMMRAPRTTSELDEFAAVPSYPSKLGAAAAKVPAKTSKQKLITTTQSASVAHSNVSTSVTNSHRQSGATQASRDSRPGNSRASGGLRDRENGGQVHVVVSSSPCQSYESNEENGRIDNQSDEELPGRFSPEDVENSDDSATSVLEDDAAPANFTSKEIMTAFGDEQFWKMRKAMQRQQTIFQTQLFELHRLTKVQQLMANSKINDHSKTPEEKNIREDKRVDESDHGEAPKTSKPDPKPDQNPAPKTPPQAQSLSTTPTYVYSTNPPAIQAANTMNYTSYHPAYNQWYAPLPYQFPFQQTFPLPAQVFNAPYYSAPVYGAAAAAPPFLPPPPPPDPRQFLTSPPVQLQPWPQQPPPGSFYPDPAAFQWMGYVNPPAGTTYHQPAVESSLQASSIHDDQTRKVHLSSQAGSTSGFSLIQRADSSSPAPAPSPAAAAAAAAAAENQRQQQHQEPRQKLAGKCSGGGRQSGSGGGESDHHGASPYSRPSGFQTVKNSGKAFERSSQGSNKAIKVTPRAVPVTAESAAEILHSIQKERPDR